MHAGEPPAAVAANHHKLSGLCQFEQAGCRSIAHHDFVHDDIGIPVLPSAQTPGEHFLLLVFEVSPFDRRPIEPRKVEGAHVALRVQRHQVHAAARCLVEGDLGRQSRGGRAVDAHHNRRVRRARRSRLLGYYGDRAMSVANQA